MHLADPIYKIGKYFNGLIDIELIKWRIVRLRPNNKVYWPLMSF